jgi:hypothetical protein
LCPACVPPQTLGSRPALQRHMLNKHHARLIKSWVDGVFVDVPVLLSETEFAARKAKLSKGSKKKSSSSPPVSTSAGLEKLFVPECYTQAFPELVSFQQSDAGSISASVPWVDEAMDIENILDYIENDYNTDTAISAILDTPEGSPQTSIEQVPEALPLPGSPFLLLPHSPAAEPVPTTMDCGVQVGGPQLVDASSGGNLPMQNGFNVEGAAQALTGFLPLHRRASPFNLSVWVWETFGVSHPDDRFVADAMVTAAVAQERAAASRLLQIAMGTAAMDPSGNTTLSALMAEIVAMGSRPINVPRPSTDARELPAPGDDAVL